VSPSTNRNILLSVGVFFEAEATEEKVEEKEVEEEMDLGGGMDMFAGDEAAGGDY